MRYANIDTSAYSGDETLFFVRIKGAEHYFNQIYGARAMDRLFGHIERRWTISEYRNADHHIDLARYSVADMTPADYDIYYASVHSDLSAIIFQCRGLRSLQLPEAKDLVFRACKYFIEFFRSQPYRLVVIASVDNYVLDVLNRVAPHFGVKVIAVQEWLVENYRRHTIYGELHPDREPTEDEVESVIAHVRRDERHYWQRGMDRGNRFRHAVWLIVRYWILYVLRYLVRYRLLGDRAYEYRFANVWRPPVSGLRAAKYFDSIDERFIEENKDRLMVVPLHTYPEQNVDYWMSDYRHADYYTSLFEAASYFREQGITLLVKEHPGFIYQRETWFYRLLKRHSNVRLIDPMSPCSDLLQKVPTVLVWHGSMGIEGLLRGRRVVAFDRNYYSNHVVPSYRDYQTARPLTEHECRSFTRTLLRGVHPI